MKWASYRYTRFQKHVHTNKHIWHCKVSIGHTMRVEVMMSSTAIMTLNWVKEHMFPTQSLQNLKINCNKSPLVEHIWHTIRSLNSVPLPIWGMTLNYVKEYLFKMTHWITFFAAEDLLDIIIPDNNPDCRNYEQFTSKVLKLIGTDCLDKVLRDLVSV